jgi:hypothetical protein
MHAMLSDGALVPYPPYGGRCLPEATLHHEEHGEGLFLDDAFSAEQPGIQ